jgi:hypothetical protein
MAVRSIKLDNMPKYNGNRVNDASQKTEIRASFSEVFES